MFVCMVGAVTDGHKYIPDAVEKGAGVIVAEREEACKGVPPEVTVILVESARHALAYLSAAYFDYPAKKLTTIGLTGTKGKPQRHISYRMFCGRPAKGRVDRNYRNGHRRDFYPC